MITKYKDFILLGLIAVITTLAIWLPFFFRLESVWGIRLPQEGMATVVANYDGPYYIVAAKTLYNPEIIARDFVFSSLPPIYYSAHYPLFPLLIKAVATVFPFLGYPYSMMLVTLGTGVLAIWMFYLLLREWGLQKYALWISVIFTIFPARWLVVRSVGSPEPLFLLTIMASIYYFQKKNYWLAGIFGALAQLTKPPAILLFVAYAITLLITQWPALAHTNLRVWLRKFEWHAYPLLLMPIALVSIYIFYGIQYNDFFAYFNSGDNIHLMFPPFQIFNPTQAWVGTFWLEEVIWVYLLGAVGVFTLLRQKETLLGSFCLIFFFSLLFVAHRDIGRYILPIVPLLFIGYSKVLISREFKFAFLILIIPIYLFALVFIMNNVTPISDWAPLL